MLLILSIAALLWFGGGYAGLGSRHRLFLVGALFLAVLLIQATLPVEHRLRELTGDSLSSWLIFLGLCAVIWLYRLALTTLRNRAQRVDPPAPTSQNTATFSGTELERYARHIVLREIGGPGQKRLKAARVLVIGAGGLGSPALLYLAAAGVGTIGVIDDDEVDNSNLQRQVIHNDADIDRPKVQSAMESMLAQNPHVEVHPYQRRLNEEIAEALFADYDIILDGTDNFTTRYLSNKIAVQQDKPLISGALGQWEGQISIFDPAHDAPCYQCIFPEAPTPGLAPSCAEAGVVSPLPGVIGSMMALEAIKLITGAGQPMRGEMLIYDALWSETRRISLKRRIDCPICGEGKNERTTT